MPQVSRAGDVVPVAAQPFVKSVLALPLFAFLRLVAFRPMLDGRLPLLALHSFESYPLAFLPFEIEFPRDTPEQPMVMRSHLANVQTALPLLEFQPPEYAANGEPSFYTRDQNLHVSFELGRVLWEHV